MATATPAGTEDDAMKKIFTTIYEQNLWGSRESVSGLGSELKLTETVRSALPILFKEFSIKSVFDAPCGDFNWMRHVVDETGIRYLGGDIVSALVIENNRKWKNANVSFRETNICSDEMPECDLWICRDCLFHLPFRDIFLALEKFAHSKIPYLLTSTHTKASDWNNRDIEVGDYRSMDLFSEPFFLPRDVKYRIEEWPPRELVLFERQQVLEALPRMRQAIGLSGPIRQHLPPASEKLVSAGAGSGAASVAARRIGDGQSISSYGRWTVQPPVLPRFAREESPSQAFDRATIQRLLQGIGTELLFGADPEAAVARLESWGAPPSEARRIIDNAVSDPLIVNGREMALMLRRRDWLLGSLEKLAQLSPRAKTVERRADLSGGEFLEFYYARNRPVVIQGEMTGWRALSKWTLPFLREAAGLPPGSDAFVAAMDETAAELAMDATAFAPLAGDLGALDKFLERGTPPREGTIRILQEGAFLSLHSDLRNVFLGQITGRTRLKLVAAADAAKVYARDGVTSEIGDLEVAGSALAKFPLLADARIYDVLLDPGDILFVPLAWWFQARALEFAVLARYVNFRWPNDHAGVFPGKSRTESGT